MFFLRKELRKNSRLVVIHTFILCFMSLFILFSFFIFSHLACSVLFSFDCISFFYFNRSLLFSYVFIGSQYKSRVYFRISFSYFPLFFFSFHVFFLLFSSRSIYKTLLADPLYICYMLKYLLNLSSLLDKLILLFYTTFLLSKKYLRSLFLFSIYLYCLLYIS